LAQHKGHLDALAHFETGLAVLDAAIDSQQRTDHGAQ
jgi:hypothetical protein